VTLALTGDVMLGRGIDQVLPHPSEPNLHEPVIRSALDYVALAEQANGPIPRPVDYAYVWGDALAAMRERADLRIINLETSVTRSRLYAPKGINYKMNPDNVACLTAAGIDCCVLANNHVLDWGSSGLIETIETLETAGIRIAGAGPTGAQAEAPAMLDLGDRGRAIVCAFGSRTSGIPAEWAAAGGKPGINLLDDLSDRSVARIAKRAEAVRRPGDVLIASIHWGGNWGYEIPREFRKFARRLIDAAGFDVVHGHSSHHGQALEVHGGKLILYGCGDFLNDYEGIAGHEAFRSDLTLLYLARISRATGDLVELTLVPFQIRQFRLKRASTGDAQWLRDTLDRESRDTGTRIAMRPDGALSATWQAREHGRDP
jgi:poly-gamma-glutamate capsule biosynthesis protein CapA/YwtB (metallophosphatase superfamily)